MNFETVLPRLVATYESGRLVPFTGAGMSRPACTDWPGLVRKLEEAAGVSLPTFAEDAPADVVVRRGNRAVRSLKAREDGAFLTAMRRAIVNRGGDDAPAQTRALARLPWPLVLTTNYDNYYAAAFAEACPDRLFSVVGRSPEDCQRVLSSLSTAGRSLLWALQGYLDQPGRLKHGPEDTARLQTLQDELVVGHEEYRRVTHRDVHFRRAFAEVFRQRSLLFLGSGIRETYVQELFGEVLELYGPSVRPHYAFIQEGEIDPDFVLARFQIVAVQYRPGEHDKVRSWLEELAQEVARQQQVSVSWSWGRIDVRSAGASGGTPASSAPEPDWISTPELEIVRGPLPERPSNHECLAVSAGGRKGEFYFSPSIKRCLTAWGVEKDEKPVPTDSGYLGTYPDRSVYAVRARSEDDRRRLSDVYDASRALFEHAASRHRCIRMQLLGAGGTDTAPAPEYDQRPFPERFSLVQTVLAWGDWRRSQPTNKCRLALHVMSQPVYADIASGRIDVLELLSCPDFRFWAEVIGTGGAIERRLFQKMPEARLEEIVLALNLSADHWTVQVSPATTPGESDAPRVRSCLERTLRSLGVVPGSTLHFRRANAT